MVVLVFVTLLVIVLTTFTTVVVQWTFGLTFSCHMRLWYCKGVGFNVVESATCVTDWLEALEALSLGRFVFCGSVQWSGLSTARFSQAAATRRAKREDYIKRQGTKSLRLFVQPQTSKLVRSGFGYTRVNTAGGTEHKNVHI